MWERFSYYGMRALLVLYMVQHFRYDDQRAYLTYGSYTALVYATPVVGGMLADRLLGHKRAVMAGAILMAAGHFAMAFDAGFFPALGLLIVGTGFFKPNISTVVGGLYSPGDTRRDSGFTIFYMGINLGAAIAPAICGAIGQTYGWHYGFGLAGIGMLVGLAVFLCGQEKLSGLGEPHDKAYLTERTKFGLSREVFVYLGAPVAVVGAWQLMLHGAWVGHVLLALGIVVTVGLVTYLIRLDDIAEKKRLLVALILTAFSVVFWAFFEQAGSSLSLFAHRNVDRRLGSGAAEFMYGLFGHHGNLTPTEIPASMFQAVNPGFILLLAPGFSWLWVWLARLGKEPSVAVKFALGLLQLGLGFGALWLGAQRAANDGMVNVGWLVLGYFLHTTGELCLSPIGLSMITKLSPPSIVGLMMGTWFLSSAFAEYAAGLIAALTGVHGETGTNVAASVPVPSVTVHIYGHVFGGVALSAILVGLLLLAIAPALAKRIEGVK
ncbi:MAG TPA: peptide MFS transporter, partial [Polyangiaceae bacterium]